MYRVVVERSAEKDLKRLPLDARFRVADALRRLVKDPRPVGSRKLVGTKHDWGFALAITASLYPSSLSEKSTNCEDCGKIITKLPGFILGEDNERTIVKDRTHYENNWH